MKLSTVEKNKITLPHGFSRMSHFLSSMLLLAVSSVFASGDMVIYPKAQSENDTRYNDLIEILQTALEKTVPKHGPYDMKESSVRLVEQRQLEMLRSGEVLTVIWGSTSEEKEALLSPILIPLRKGLLGYRVSLINKNSQSKIDSLQSLEDLQAITIGQGNGWGDVDIYQHNGIKVLEALYDGLFKMVNVNRLDLFPRGINEAFVEYQERSGDLPNLAVEENLMIYYPWPYYFFFNKENSKLKDRVEEGLRMMIDDGSFDEIFWRYNRQSIDNAEVFKRRIIKIENPFLPASAPVGNDSLWFDPLTDKN